MLTDMAARKAKPKDRPYKLTDSGGLYLMVLKSGVRSWRMNYRFDGKEKTLTFGQYPEVDITEARDRRDSVRRQLRDKIDPDAERKREPAIPATVHTFEGIARDWHHLNTPKWKPHHAADVLHGLVEDVFPDLGKKNITAIDAPMVLATLRKVEARGAIDGARRLRQRISAVFVYGIASGLCSLDPAAVIMRAMAPMKEAGRRPALLDITAARTILADCDKTPAMAVTRLAMRLLALTAVRPGEVMGAAWDEFEGMDGAEPLWRIPKERMKGERGQQYEHLVPLAPEAVAVLDVARGLTGRGPLVFPNVRSSHAPMSGNAMGYLLNRAGYYGRHVPHGWRSTFSTTMNEIAEREGRVSDRAIIDLMLAHVPKDAVEQAYNRAAYMPRRREIARTWADQLMAGAAPPAALLDLPSRTINNIN